jgi:cobalt-precorrin-7 (C5)-methyltransferase
MAKIRIVGVGPGSPEYVTPIAKKAVATAQVIIGSERALSMFAGDISGETIKLTAKNINSILKNAVESSQQGKLVVLLSTGDPGFSGLLRTFSKLTIDRNIEVDVIPGISSVQVCAARLLLPWDEMRLFTFHQHATEEEKRELFESVRSRRIVMLLPESKSFFPAEVAKFLIGKSVSANTPAFVCENLTLKDERIVSTTLAGISEHRFSSLCVMVIKPA